MRKLQYAPICIHVTGEARQLACGGDRRSSMPSHPSMVTFRAICCIHNSFGWMVIPAGGELTADFRLGFGNPARDAERQAASHHREHHTPTNV